MGKAVANQQVEVRLANGEIKRLKTDANGKVTIKNAAVGRIQITPIPMSADATRVDMSRYAHFMNIDDPLNKPKPKAPTYSNNRYQSDDNVKNNKWTDLKKGLEGIKEKGSFKQAVITLQSDLFRMGYWITDGKSLPAPDQPMVYDGSFNDGLESAVKTFQFELKLTIDGIVNKVTADKIIEELQRCDREKSHFWRKGCTADDWEGKPTFYQLPSSPTHYYKRYGGIYANGKVSGVLKGVLHNDLWGTRETITALMKCCNEWAQKKYTYTSGTETPTDVMEIGDISLWKGGQMYDHQTHKGGYGIDIRSSLVGGMETSGAKNPHFDIEKSIEFAKICKDNGFTRIYTMCPGISSSLNAEATEKSELFVTQLQPHQHHFHLDQKKTLSTNDLNRIKSTTVSSYSYCGSCGHKKTCGFDLKDYVNPPEK